MKAGEGLGHQGTILVKPHHFLDIIKLYGAGIQRFVKDEVHGHDFYKVANTLMEHPGTLLELTLGGDRICAPCKSFDGTRCTDPLDVIPGYRWKEDWNQEIDRRLFHFTGYLPGTVVDAKELCQRLLDIRSLIYEVWLEEPDEKTQLRYDHFCKGAARYLDARRP